MTFQQATEIWAGFVGSQTPQEFMEASCQKGLPTVEAAVTAYIRDIPDITGENYSTEELEKICEGLITYLESHGYH